MVIGFIIYVSSQLISSISTNLIIFIFFYSVVGGIGLGMNVNLHIRLIPYSSSYQYTLHGSVSLRIKV